MSNLQKLSIQIQTAFNSLSMLGVVNLILNVVIIAMLFGWL